MCFCLTTVFATTNRAGDGRRLKTHKCKSDTHPETNGRPWTMDDKLSIKSSDSVTTSGEYEIVPEEIEQPSGTSPTLNIANNGNINDIEKNLTEVIHELENHDIALGEENKFATGKCFSYLFNNEQFVGLPFICFAEFEKYVPIRKMSMLCHLYIFANVVEALTQKQLERSCDGTHKCLI